MSKVIFETGATSHAVNELILYTDQTKELADRRDNIYKAYLPGVERTKKLINPTKSMKYEFINILLYRAMNKYLDEFPNHEDHQHIEKMTVEQQDEFAQLYAEDFENWKFEHGYK